MEIGVPGGRVAGKHFRYRLYLSNKLGLELTSSHFITIKDIQTSSYDFLFNAATIDRYS
jgi:hypothetical protein